MSGKRIIKKVKKSKTLKSKKIDFDGDQKQSKAVSDNSKKVNASKPKIKNVEPHKHFVVSDGRRVRNLLELVEVMDDMTDEVFSHHVNEYKNDFAAWASDVLEDTKLSEKLSTIKTRHKHQVEILKHMVKRLIK